MQYLRKFANIIKEGVSMDTNKIKDEIILIGQRLYSKDLTSGTSGNISARCESNYLVTASGTSLADLTRDDILLVDENGHAVNSEKKPSSESMLHIEIYKKREDINALVHCHAPMLCAFAVAHMDLDMPIMAENILYFGKIPVADYGMPSSKDLVENTSKYFENNDTVLMANHGVICGDSDLRHAFYKLETAETYAKVCLYNRMLGKTVPLDEHAIADLEKLKLALKS